MARFVNVATPPTACTVVEPEVNCAVGATLTKDVSAVTTLLFWSSTATWMLNCCPATTLPGMVVNCRALGVALIGLYGVIAVAFWWG